MRILEKKYKQEGDYVYSFPADYIDMPERFLIVTRQMKLAF
jgi:hypothetical protein